MRVVAFAVLTLACSARAQLDHEFDLVASWYRGDRGFDIQPVRFLWDAPVPGHAISPPYQRVVFPTGGWIHQVVMDENNEAFLWTGIWPPNGNRPVLARITRTGQMTTVYAGTLGWSPPLVTPAGNYLFQEAGATPESAPYGYSVIKPDGTGRHPLFAAAHPLYLAVWDEETGDLVATGGRLATSFGYADILRCTMTGSITTLASIGGFNAWMGIDYDPRTGDFFAATSGFVPFPPAPRPTLPFHLCRIPRGGAGYVIATNQGNPNGSVRVARNGDIYTAQCGITRLTRDASGNWNGRFLGGSFGQCLGMYSTTFYTGLEIDRSRNLSGRGSYSPGSAYGLRLSFPADSGRPYLGAASLSVRPGLQAGRHWIPLNPDPLLLLSLQAGQIFEGFTGTLDAAGRAQATVRIPPIEGLRGLRVFFAFVTFDPQGGIRSVSNLMGVTIGLDL
jgi:hypothetical protein